jgi:hypothetical protein
VKTALLIAVSCLLLLNPTIARATSITIGTPGNSLLSTPVGPSPNLRGTFINFDALTPFTTAPSVTVGSVTFSSPDGLEVLPFSSQSSPNYLFDASPDGTADLFIRLASGTTAIGVGIADSDPVSITLRALNAGGMPFGSAFVEDLTMLATFINTGNGYFVVSDLAPDIFGLEITQSLRDPINFSGLAIDDVQVAVPEPGTLALLLTGVGLVARKRRL